MEFVREKNGQTDKEIEGRERGPAATAKLERSSAKQRSAEVKAGSAPAKAEKHWTLATNGM